MKNRISIIEKCILIISIISYFYLVFWKRNQYIYNMSYLKCILFMILLSLFIYIYGIVQNKEKAYKSNTILYILFFAIILFSITFYIGRPEIRYYKGWWKTSQYKPFYTIMSQFRYGDRFSIIKNIIGNSIMLMPLSFLLMIKDKKYNNVLKQSLIILPTIIIIEFLQAITRTGSFDIDDIILNYIGTLVFTFLITRFNIIEKIRNVFYNDFKLKDKTKYTLFYIFLAIVIIFNISLFIK